MAVTVSIPDTAASFESKIDALTRELAQARGGLAEALRREAATAEVLEVISRSPIDVQPVFDTIVASAVSLCGARMGAVYRFDGELLHLVAHHNYGPEVLEELRRTHPRPPQADQASGRAILARAVVQLEDTLADPHYRHEIALAGDFRSILAVPMLRNGAPIGVIVITRSEVGPFSNGHIELLKTFTDQAVIAIENARLFEAEQARAKELSEALEFQTASSEVLGVISSAPGKVGPVFDTILESARRLCGAEYGHLLLYDGATWRPAALHNLPKAYADFWTRAQVVAGPETLLGRILATGRPYQVADALVGDGYRARTPLAIATVEWGGRAHTIRCALAQGRQGHRCHRALSQGGACFQRQADCAAVELRPSGSYRHREHAIVRGRADTHQRATGKPRIPNCDIRGAGRDLALAE